MAMKVPTLAAWEPTAHANWSVQFHVDFTRLFTTVCVSNFFLHNKNLGSYSRVNCVEGVPCLQDSTEFSGSRSHHTCAHIHALCFNGHFRGESVLPSSVLNIILHCCIYVESVWSRPKLLIVHRILWTAPTNLLPTVSHAAVLLHSIMQLLMCKNVLHQ